MRNLVNVPPLAKKAQFWITPMHVWNPPPLQLQFLENRHMTSRS